MATQNIEEQIQVSKEQQAEIQYLTQILSKDLINVTTVIAEVSSVFRVFSKDKDHQMIPIQYNRCALQMDLSNMIHKDLVYTTVDPVLQKHLVEQRLRCGAIFDKVKSQLTNEEELIKLTQMHIENTVNSQNPIFCEYDEKKTNRVPDFTSDVVKRIFAGMAEVDHEREQILKGSRVADFVDEELVLSKAKRCADIALLKAFTNFYLEQVKQFVANLQEDQKLIIQQYFEGNFTQKLQEKHLQELNNTVWASDELINLFHRDIQCKLEILSYFQLFCMKLALEPKTEESSYSDKVIQFYKQVTYVDIYNQIDLYNQEYQRFIKQQQEQLTSLEQNQQKGQMEEEHIKQSFNKQQGDPIQEEIPEQNQTNFKEIKIVEEQTGQQINQNIMESKGLNGLDGKPY